ncbi:MAG: accessory Sec system protein Asp2, partial [Pediococcus pentosaceus]|nr:accessory Sec system protein Asp2 [Pediococcus pentosaceus]
MKNKLIHLGLPIPGLSEQLKENFDYIDIPFEKLWEPNAKKGLLFIKGKLNPLYLNALFLITQDAYLKETELLKKLPGNKTLIDNTLTLPLASQNILELKNAQFIEVGDIKALAKDLNQTFYSGQWGFKFTFDNIQFEPYFKGRIEQLGHNYIRFIDQNIQAYQKVANWGGPLGVAGNTLWEIRTEFKRQNPTTDVRLDVSMINPYTNEIYYSQSFENDQLNEVL